ncbi:CDP-alcohol phosphatidyltransferase family protein [Aeromicrobium chenweiae]|uniref:CDP-alcohol phosphatidyltransferase n=1 Tax=Aeromicrobium chenweiae TaxID=2079793 RepID=A0A2S0WJ56_9ACTN|nr:CDP-alcohol phosphatidyltransferase family protein [Aeromicrobium chenweiae]AWB91327.1 CDP-alcohol phosphatidyltransferase [Aeromicrobium chenweiae]TGN30546.1 CDP-alcohol phosphatidyltransferase family protein [Aeromicrobium chenweiae]
MNATTGRLSVDRGARAAYAALARAQKSGAGVPWYMRVVNRRAGRLIAAVAAQTRATPNHMTAASFAAFLAGAGLLVGLEPGVPMAVGAMLLLQLGFAFDSADGQLARLRGTGSPAGEWLDHVVDSARHLLFHLAVLIALHRFTDVSDAVLLVPLVFALVSTVRFFAQILAEQLARRDPVAGPESVPRFGVWIQAPADTGLLNLVVVLWAWTTAFLWAYGVFAALNTLLLAATFVRRHRELAALGRES